MTAEIPESALDSGSDGGDIGDRLDPTAGTQDGGGAVEDSADAVSAVNDDGVVPGLVSPEAGQPDDVTPVFQEPQVP